MYKIRIIYLNKSCTQKKIEINIQKKNNTSFPESFNIEPIAVPNKIFRSGFFGAVVQFAYALADDVVKALAPEVIVTLA